MKIPRQCIICLLAFPLLWVTQVKFFNLRYDLSANINAECPWCIQDYSDSHESYINFNILKSFINSDRLLLSYLALVRAIYYYGEQALVSGDYNALYDMLDQSISLDPEWDYPYQYGALLLPISGPDIEGGYDLVEQATERFSDDWRFWFIKGYYEMKYFDDNLKASKSFFMAFQKPGSPRYLAFLAATLSDKASQDKLTEFILRESLKFFPSGEERKRILDRLEK